MEDTDLCRRIDSTSKLLFWPYVTVTHAHAQGSYKHLSHLKLHLRAAIGYFNKWDGCESGSQNLKRDRHSRRRGRPLGDSQDGHQPCHAKGGLNFVENGKWRSLGKKPILPVPTMNVSIFGFMGRIRRRPQPLLKAFQYLPKMKVRCLPLRRLETPIPLPERPFR